MPKICQNLEKYRRIVISGGRPGEGNERLDLDPGGLATQNRAAKKYDIYNF